MNVIQSQLAVNMCCFVGGGISGGFQTTLLWYSFWPPSPAPHTGSGGIYGGKGDLKTYFGVSFFTETFVTPQCDFQGRLPRLQTTVLEARPVVRNFARHCVSVRRIFFDPYFAHPCDESFL